MKGTKLDEEFPALPSPSKPTNQQQQSAATTQNTAKSSQGDTSIKWRDFEAFNAVSPENIAHTDMTPQDFGYALTSSLNFIPDAPYEITPGQEDKSDETQSIYPKTPMMKLLQPENFKNYSNDTLFYIFFYSVGTPQQLFAGKELKKRGWVYHKQYQTWFKRIGEPTETGEGYENGRYEYFDHGSQEGWTIRQRQNFKLEFAQIENE